MKARNANDSGDNSATTRELVELLRDGPSPLRPLLSRRPRWAVYRALSELRERGAVVPGPTAGTWALSAGAESEPSPSRAFETPTLPGVPQLDVLPSREHRALGGLILLAATARRHYEHHHASFVLFSASGLRGKTFLGRWAALVLGADPDRVVVNAGVESGRSLGVRRKASGEIAAVRAALAGPLLCVDEFLRGPVKSTCLVLIGGRKSLPVECETVTVNAVVILAMNSRPDASTPEESTTLDAAMLRRCFAADFERIRLDDAFRRDGEERLGRIKSLGPIALPDIRTPVADERAIRDRVADLLDIVLDSTERMGSLDLVLLGQLAAAAVAWGLTPDDAVALVVHDACVAWSTTGWTAPEWEARLGEAIGGATPPEAPALSTPRPALSPDAGDYLRRVSRLDEVARAHGLGDPDALDAALVEGAPLRGARGEGRGELLEALARAQLTAAEMRGLVEVMKELGVGGERAADALRVVHRIGQRADPERVIALADALFELGCPVRDAARWIAWGRERLRSFVGTIQALVAAEELAADRADAAAARAELHEARLSRVIELWGELRRARDPEVRAAVRAEAGERVERVVAAGRVATGHLKSRPDRGVHLEQDTSSSS